MYGISANGVVIAKYAAPITVRNNKPVLISDTLSLRRHVRRIAAQRWEIDTNLEPLGEGEDAIALFIHTTLNGLHTKIQAVMPQPVAVIRKIELDGKVGPITLAGATIKGSSSIAVTSNIKVGTFVAFSGHGKVYLVTSKTSETITVYPNLVTGVPSGNRLFHEDDVLLQCYYDTGTVSGMVFTDGILMDLGSVKLVEAL